MTETVKPPKPRKPQDHKPKADEPMVITVAGGEYTIDPASLDDFELLDDLRSLDAGDTSAALSMPRVLKAFLGLDQYRVAMNSLRDPDTGRVSIEAGAGFVADMLGALNPNS